MINRKFWLALGCVAFVLMASFRGYAGGPLALRAAGAPYLWPGGGVNIPFNPDQGGLGPMNNAAAVAQTTAAFGIWQAIPSATATHVNAGSLPFDVDETNYLPFLEPAAPDGLSAIVYDEDGAIFDELFGANSGVLGFAGPEWINTATGDILEGVSFLNGAAIVAGEEPLMLAVQVHEYGHYQNLAHSVVNGQMLAFGDNSGPTPNDTFPGGPGAALETWRRCTLSSSTTMPAEHPQFTLTTLRSSRDSIRRRHLPRALEPYRERFCFPTTQHRPPV